MSGDGCGGRVQGYWGKDVLGGKLSSYPDLSRPNLIF